MLARVSGWPWPGRIGDLAPEAAGTYARTLNGSPQAHRGGPRAEVVGSPCGIHATWQASFRHARGDGAARRPGCLLPRFLGASAPSTHAHGGQCAACRRPRVLASACHRAVVALNVLTARNLKSPPIDAERLSVSERVGPAGVVVELGYARHFDRGLDVRELNLQGGRSAGRCPREVARAAVAPDSVEQPRRALCRHFHAESEQLEVVSQRGGGVDVPSRSSSPVAYQRRPGRGASVSGDSGRASLVNSESGPAHGRKSTHPAIRACPAAAKSR